MLLTVKETSQNLSVSAATVRRLIASNELPSHRIGRRSIRIAQDDINAYLGKYRSKVEIKKPVAARQRALKINDSFWALSC